MPPREPSRAPRRIALAAGGVVLAWLLWPVEHRVAGVGILRPRFRHSALVHAPDPQSLPMVTRVDVQYLQRVEGQQPLFAYLTAPRWSVQVAAPRQGAPPPPSPPPSPAEQAGRARQSAVDEWCTRARAAGAPPWEEPFCLQWGERLRARTAIERHDERTQANQQSGRDALNAVYTFDDAQGQFVPTNSGQTLSSSYEGTVVALWIAPRMQLLPSVPALEIMVDDTGLEVLGLVPAAERRHLAGRALEGTVSQHETPIASSITAVKGGEIGLATLEPAEVATLFPGVSVAGPSVVARVELAAKPDPTDIGRVVRFEISSGLRPRVWSWIVDR